MSSDRNTLGCARMLAVLAGLFCAVAQAAPRADDDTETRTVIRRRKTKTIGESAKSDIVRNPKGKSQSKHPYSDRSFSNPANREKTSLELRRRFDEAFNTGSWEASSEVCTNAIERAEHGNDRPPGAAARP